MNKGKTRLDHVLPGGILVCGEEVSERGKRGRNEKMAEVLLQWVLVGKGVISNITVIIFSFLEISSQIITP